jgi:hypothetical protein
MQMSALVFAVPHHSMSNLYLCLKGQAAAVVADAALVFFSTIPCLLIHMGPANCLSEAYLTYKFF